MSDNYELLPPIDNRQWKLGEPRVSSVVARPMQFTPTEDAGFDILQPLRILLKRRVWLYICTPMMLAAAALVCIVMPPRYVATCRIQLLNQEMGRLSLGDSANGAEDGYDFYATLLTDVSVMQSDNLALQVIKELNLADTAGFGYSPLIKTREVTRQMALPMDQAPLKRTAILNKFRANLSVDIVPGSRLIAVSYADSDPDVAAKIVNKLVSDFVEYNFQVRYNATTKATDFLRQQLVDLKDEVEESEERAVNLQKASGTFGSDASHDIVAARLEQLNNEVVTAETNRVAKEALYNLARNGNSEAIAGLLGSSGGSGGSAALTSSETPNAVPLISHLRQEEADLNAQYAEAVTEYGSAYPRLIQMKDRMAALQSSIQTELNKVVQSAKDEYELAASQEANAEKMFADQQEVASRMNDRAAAYTIAKHEADSSRTLYDNLLQKLKEADVLAGLRSSDLNIVDPAAVPGRPARPRVKLYLALGALAGLALGAISAFVVEAMDRTIRSERDVEFALRLPVLALIPVIEAVTEKSGIRQLAESSQIAGTSA